MFAGRLGHGAEQVIVSGSSLADIEPRALAYYRQRMSELWPGTETTELPDMQLLTRLGATGAGGQVTRAGLVLFGTQAALRQHLPAVRIDLVQVAGTQWVESPEEPFLEQLELRQDAVAAFRRAQDWLARTLPKTSHFVPGDPERKDDTTVPARVLREALVNAIIHRDYAVNEPILVVRYRDRVEIRSPGYSLVNREEWGESGSRTRNQAIAEVFRDLNLAETKGTGIQMMRRRMLEAERRPPEFRSDRKANRFTSVLSLEHLLGEEDREWLEQLGAGRLDLAARQALLVARQKGRVANADLRDRTGLDTLAASEVLKRLRDTQLLVQHSDGGRAQSYYVLAGQPMRRQMDLDEAVSRPADAGELRADAGELRADAGELRADAGELRADAGELRADAGGSGVQPSAFSAATRRLVEGLGKRPRKANLRAAITALCSERELPPHELAMLLGNRVVKHLVADHLTPLVEEGVLERTGESPTDPRQAYRSATS
jgi:ATP-dependent DNA helicase RecG